MSPVRVRSIGGYAGSPEGHPQRLLDASLRTAGYQVEALELPDNTNPDLETCIAFLHAQCDGLDAGILILHSLASRVFMLLVDRLRQADGMHQPLVHTAVLMAPANGRYIADWVPEVASFFTQDLWIPSLQGAAQHLLIAASDNDFDWEEAESDLAKFRQQPGVDILVLEQEGHLNEADVSGDLAGVQAWLRAVRPSQT